MEDSEKGSYHVLRVAPGSLRGGSRGGVFSASSRGRILIAHSSFPEPCGHLGPQPSPKHTEGRARERFQVSSASIACTGRGAELSELRVEDIGDDERHSVSRQLLALHSVRRRMERVAARRAPRWAAMAITSPQLIRVLRELVAALDRRVPQVDRAGEAAIASDAAALRARALERIQELERQPSNVERV